MASEPTTEYELNANSYAAFDAISLRNLIVSRLNDQNVFTDQNYIGSNMACIIDIVSFAYNTLIFYLNKTSTESSFSEVQLQENINRIVKLLDYKPIGYQTSTLVFEASAAVSLGTEAWFDDKKDIGVGRSYTIPRYSYLTVGGVSFSFNEDVTFKTLKTGNVALEDLSNTKLLYQGIYKEYPEYTAQGNAGEIITLANTNGSIDHFNIDVYVYETKNNQWTQYTEVPSLYTQRSYSRTYEKRLNPNNDYEITFGDGTNGRQLVAGERVVIFYLESNKERGVVGPGLLQTAGKVAYTSLTYKPIVNSLNVENFNYITTEQFNVVGSTLTQDIEDTESIRKNAPGVFKSQYRLVTKDDYESFIRTNFAGFITDVQVMSNWDYVGKYLKYFNDIMIKPTEFRQILLNQVQYADSCNFNNIYVCALPKLSPKSTLKYLLPAQKEAILSNLNSVKTLTTEVVFMDPIYKAVSFGVKTNTDPVIEDKDLCRLQLIKSVSSKRDSNSILKDADVLFKDFFNPSNIRLGQMLSHEQLLNKLLSIDGVLRVRTTRIDSNEAYEGLSMLVWNPVYPELDKQIIVNNLQLRPYEYMYFSELSKASSKLEVVSESAFIQ
jgi:hypothetical protein